MQSKRDTIPTGDGTWTSRRRDEPASNTLRAGHVPESRESAERVTISSAPHERRSDDRASRRTHVEVIELPARWTERLLALWSELPVAAGDRAVTSAVVDALASMLLGSPGRGLPRPG